MYNLLLEQFSSMFFASSAMTQYLEMQVFTHFIYLFITLCIVSVLAISIVLLIIYGKEPEIRVALPLGLSVIMLAVLIGTTIEASKLYAAKHYPQAFVLEQLLENKQ